MPGPQELSRILSIVVVRILLPLGYHESMPRTLCPMCLRNRIVYGNRFEAEGSLRVVGAPLNGVSMPARRSLITS